MSEDKVELSSDELIRQAREALAPPKVERSASMHVDGPTIQDLLRAPLSSDSLLPQRAVDYWDDQDDESAAAAWEPIQREPVAAPQPAGRRVRKRPFMDRTRDQPPAPPSGQPPLPPLAPAPFDPSAPQWLDPVRDQQPLPPAPAPSPAPSRAPRPLGPPAQPLRRGTFPWRFIFVGVVALSVLISSFAGDNLASQNDIEVGDCYDSSEFATADAVSCALPHRVQVFALVQVNVLDDGAVNRCFNEAVALGDSGGIPPDTIVPDGTFVGAVNAPDSPAGTTFCYFESPTAGLVGSVLFE